MGSEPILSVKQFVSIDEDGGGHRDSMCEQALTLCLFFLLSLLLLLLFLAPVLVRHQHHLLVEAGTAVLTLVDDSCLVLQLQVHVQLVQPIDGAPADRTVEPLSELAV